MRFSSLPLIIVLNVAIDGGHMNIILGKNNGFCAGVRHTISKAEELLAKYHTLDCLGEIIHNKEVVSSLEKKGLRIINSIEEAKNRVIIRAHGTTKEVYEYAEAHGIELIDLTCPNVLKIHEQVQNLVKEKYFICLLGVKNHPETIGTYSFCGENSCIVEDFSDLSPTVQKIHNSKLKRVLIIAQTTFSVTLFEQYSQIIADTLWNHFKVKIENSICNSTNLRQFEAAEIAVDADLMIVIGGENSSNTQKLYDISKNFCKNVMYVQTKDDLNLRAIKKFNNIGIIAGASTPDYITQEIAEACRSLA